MSDFRHWYKDRYFPEIKVSNSDILAVVPDPQHLQRLIDHHNEVLQELATFRHGLLEVLRERGVEDSVRTEAQIVQAFRELSPVDHDTIIRSILATYTHFRGELRQLLYENGIQSNLEWSEQKVLDALRTLIGRLP